MQVSESEPLLSVDAAADGSSRLLAVFSRGDQELCAVSDRIRPPSFTQTTTGVDDIAEQATGKPTGSPNKDAHLAHPVHLPPNIRVRIDGGDTRVVSPRLYINDKLQAARSATEMAETLQSSLDDSAVRTRCWHYVVRTKTPPYGVATPLHVSVCGPCLQEIAFTMSAPPLSCSIESMRGGGDNWTCVTTQMSDRVYVRSKAGRWTDFFRSMIAGGCDPRAWKTRQADMVVVQTTACPPDRSRNT